MGMKDLPGKHLPLQSITEIVAKGVVVCLPCAVQQQSYHLNNVSHSPAKERLFTTLPDLFLILYSTDNNCFYSFVPCLL